MSLYTDLIKAGCEVSNWQSDLYVARTEKALAVFKEHDYTPQPFLSAIDGRPMLEAPFMYDPFWERQ